MKIKLLLTLLVLSVSLNIMAQIGHQRGLYVDDFVILQNNNDLDLTASILGTAKEDDLLQYCLENHITYITLYNLRRIFTGAPYEDSKRLALSQFICKAKNDYCIKYVGGSVGLASATLVGGFYRQSAPYVFEEDSPYYESLSYLEDSIPPSDDRFFNAESLKLALRLLDIGSVKCCGTGVSPACPEGHLDILITEYEFWRTTTSLVNRDYNDNQDANDYVGLLTSIDNIRNTHNSTSTYTVYVETYIGLLDDPNTGVSRCDIANFIDGPPTGTPNVDRILSHYYFRDPDRLYNLTTPNFFYTNRFMVFCENTVPTSCTTTFQTKDATNYQPIFSAEGTLTGGSMASNFLGNHLIGGSDRNIFTVERDFYDDFMADNSTNVHGVAKSNDLAPGGAQWYNQSLMTKTFNHPITFLAYSTT